MCELIFNGVQNSASLAYDITQEENEHLQIL